MDIFREIKEILTEILDVEASDITPETYLIRDLDAESIDLLELAVVLNSRFNVDIKDDEIFLRKLRLYIAEAEEQGKDVPRYLMEKTPFLTRGRLEAIIADLEGGPVLKVEDLVSYVAWQIKKEKREVSCR